MTANDVWLEKKVVRGVIVRKFNEYFFISTVSLAIIS